MLKFNILNFLINNSYELYVGSFFNDLTFFIFEIFSIFSLLILLVFFVIISNKKTRLGYINVSLHLTYLLLFVSLILLFILNNNIFYSYSIFNGFYFNDYSSIFFKNIIVLFFILFTFLILNYLEKRKNYDFEFLVILFLSLFSSLLILNSNDLLSLFFIIELQSLTFYILVASKQTSTFSTEAALKYFVLGCFSSGVILFGISLVYGFTGFFDYENLSMFSSALVNFDLTNKNNLLPCVGVIIGLLFLTVGLLFKIGSVPFHMWMPDVYEGSPMIFMSYLSTIPKISLVYIYIKLYYGVFFDMFFIYQPLLIICSILSIILGSIAAIYQVKIKRLLTYSMITNTSYIILSISLGDVSGLFVTLFYLISYVFIMIGLFFVFISLRDRSKGILFKKISSLINFSEINPFISFSLLILLFSIAGVPPLLGFYGKFFLFMFSLKLKLYWVTILFVVFSTVSVFYYIRLVKLIYFNRSSGWVFVKEVPIVTALVVSFITIINLMFFINPNLIFKLIYNFSLFIYL